MNQAIYHLTMFDKNTKNENTGGLVNEIITGSAVEIPNALMVCMYVLTALAIGNAIYKAYKVTQKTFKKRYSTNAIV